ncbi:MAG TPA: metalloregulator ArsR/SmtB family transcription factor [Candidatus Acidoferrales bacterium]|nr:metalloregulator ArsR/SmtB family transcription factor [Candidatus Acidoferrales bacterium]
MIISVKPYIIVAMPRKEKPFPIDLLFRALADRTRLRLLNLIADKEICVCYFVEILRMSQPKISRHLAYLRHAGIVAARRQGRWMHYRLLAPRDRVAAAILKETLAHFRQIPEMQGDLAKLETSCCNPNSAGRPLQAPQPLILPGAAQ